MTVNKINEDPSIQQTKSDIFTSLSSMTGSKRGIEEDESLKKPVCKDPSRPEEEKKEENDPTSEGHNGVIVTPRILVVSNRLPASAEKEDNGTWSLKDSPGGLASALLGIKDFEVVYIGWAGLSKPKSVDDLNALTSAFASKKCVPVFIEEETKDKYYDGYCNNILWPLFHYLGIPQEDRLDTIQSQFEAYETANKFFAEVVIENYKAGDIVWCHDYHLMFLPEYLKNHNSEMKVGWFLHTSFPSSEVYIILPHRKELLYAVLHADLVGFQTYDYARHFVSACNRILGLEGTPEGVDDCGKLTRVAAFPVGIDPDRFIKRIALPEVQKRIDCLISELSGRKVLLGVDRLDMIKGIPQKLLAFEKFLEDNAKLCDKVVLMQIAVPTRTEVPEYKKLASQVHEIVGLINGRFGTLTKFPIHHLDRSLDFAELCALYAITENIGTDLKENVDENIRLGVLNNSPQELNHRRHKLKRILAPTNSCRGPHELSEIFGSHSKLTEGGGGKSGFEDVGSVVNGSDFKKLKGKLFRNSPLRPFNKDVKVARKLYSPKTDSARENVNYGSKAKSTAGFKVITNVVPTAEKDSTNLDAEFPYVPKERNLRLHPEEAPELFVYDSQTILVAAKFPPPPSEAIGIVACLDSRGNFLRYNELNEEIPSWIDGIKKYEKLNPTTYILKSGKHRAIEELVKQLKEMGEASISTLAEKAQEIINANSYEVGILLLGMEDAKYKIYCAISGQDTAEDVEFARHIGCGSRHVRDVEFTNTMTKSEICKQVIKVVNLARERTNSCGGPRYYLMLSEEKTIEPKKLDEEKHLYGL